MKTQGHLSEHLIVPHDKVSPRNSSHTIVTRPPWYDPGCYWGNPITPNHTYSPPPPPATVSLSLPCLIGVTAAQVLHTNALQVWPRNSDALQV